jgi:uncharacterized protein YbjQ (UPF0145 family)
VDPAIESAINLGFPLLLLLSTYLIGNRVERRHYRTIRDRERRWQRLPAITFRATPSSWQVAECGLVTGSVVVSVDYFKRFLAGLRNLIGGRVKSYESLMDRARREAVLRLKAEAIERGYNAVVNVRLETARMANASHRGRGIAGLEVLAYGTGLKLRREPS